MPSLSDINLIWSLINQFSCTISFLDRKSPPDLLLPHFSGFTPKWLRNVSTYTKMPIFLKCTLLCTISVLLYVLVLLPGLSSQMRNKIQSILLRVHPILPLLSGSKLFLFEHLECNLISILLITHFLMLQLFLPLTYSRFQMRFHVTFFGASTVAETLNGFSTVGK